MAKRKGILDRFKKGPRMELAKVVGIQIIVDIPNRMTTYGVTVSNGDVPLGVLYAALDEVKSRMMQKEAAQRVRMAGIPVQAREIPKPGG